MEKEGKTVPHGLNRLELMKSFRLCVRSLLTAFPFEDLSKAFPNFSKAEQDRLYQLYIQIITALHENMQDEFDSLCQKTQVGTILDTVEDLVEQQSLDPLFSQKTNIKFVKQDLLAAKKNEILLLQELLDKVEDEKHSIKARIKLLKKTHKETSMTTDAVEKLSSMMANYSSYNGRL
ncbi:uncharacterized protein LOC141594442 [Silene latifolia]|uniref:uncharacterized protein LOC141594442 n=1 Tax=Silene latifolia TaxID=37657 RepID=UPI003D772D22